MIYAVGMRNRIPSPLIVLLLLSAFVFPGRAADLAIDERAIRELNTDYLQSFVKSDVARYRELLADDFRAVLADGREITKREFLEQSAIPPAVKKFRGDDLVIRLYGETAVASGRVTYERPDGTPTETRYVNVYVRRGGRWQVVSAQMTRVTKS